jgi:xanthine dehydrogenase iron-sulfur cluster and FAD-binding subunit A
MWRQYFAPTTIDEAVRLLGQHASRARIVAGATDLILELERGIRPGVDTLIDVTRIAELDRIVRGQDGVIHLGPLVTHNDCATSGLLRTGAYPLARAAWEVGAPQIRNRGTIAGNLITASPANDTIPPLMALAAEVTLRSTRGTRRVPLSEFYTGVRRTVMDPDEMLTDIGFTPMAPGQRGAFVKIALRRAQAVSVVNAAVILKLSGRLVTSAVITLGAVAPTIIHASKAETYLAGKVLDGDVILAAAALAAEDAHPIDDLRGSASYRREMVRVSVARGLRSLITAGEPAGMPAQPITLGSNGRRGRSIGHIGNGGAPIREIHTSINGRELTLSTGSHKTLLRFLREDAGLTGTKEGCAEGECGACTVLLDGIAVMACMVPAPRADGATVVTVEGLGSSHATTGHRPEALAEVKGRPRETLHPLQQAFIDAAAVQCGYCTPGFLMSGAKLLEERPHPSRSEIEEALTGNLCRCTGYYQIVKAIEQAAGASEVTHG